MSSGSIRIIQLPEKSSVNTDDYMAVDSSANGTKKVKFTDLLDDNLSASNKAADAQATGEAINNISARVDNMINTQQNESVTTLWTGTLDTKNQSVTLSQSIANFDFIDVYVGGVDAQFIRRHVANTINIDIQIQNMSDDASVQFMRWWETGVSITGTTATITKCIKCYWDDFSQVPVVSQATNGATITRIDGVKIGHVENDEIVDARVGVDETSYPTLGDAIRGQVTDLKSDITAHDDILFDTNLFDTKTVLTASTTAFVNNGDGTYTIGTDDYGTIMFGNKVLLPAGVYLLHGAPTGWGFLSSDSSVGGRFVQNEHSTPMVIRIAQPTECYLGFRTNGNPSESFVITPFLKRAITIDIDQRFGSVDAISKYGADPQLLEINELDTLGVRIVKQSDGSFIFTGTATDAINLEIYSFTQEIGKTYHYKLNPNYDNTGTEFYVFLYNVNGSTQWNKAEEVTWTATDASEVSVRLYCGNGISAGNRAIKPIINSNYSNAELYEQITESTERISNVETAAISGKVVLFDNSNITWRAPGTVMNYFSGEITTNNPNVFSVTENFDVSEIQNLVVHFAGHTTGNNGIVFFDSNNKYINGIAPTGGSNGSYDCIVQIPPNAKWCAVGRYGNDTISVYLLVSDFTKQIITAIDLQNTLFSGGVREGWSEYNAFPMMPSNYLTYAKTAYASLMAIMKSESYDAIPAFIITDSHGNVMAPFAWLNCNDKSIKCLQLGDIVNDYYNEYEINQYYLWAKKIDNICTVVGNHDANYHSESMSNYLLTKSFVTTNRHLGGRLNYYYVDDDDYRVRYICLDPFVVGANGTSSTMDFDALQLKWFIDVLSDTPYDCVILTHCPLCDSANDRDGDAIEVSGYPTNLHIAQAIMQSYQNKGSVNYTVDGVRVTGDFTNTTHRILCALCGHVHAEGSSFQYGVRHYVADAYLSNRLFSSAFIAIDRDSNLLRVLKFDNTQNYAEWDLSLKS